MNLKSLKNKLKDDTLDLSLCDLKEVPVKEIETVMKATHLDLSNNLLVSLPSTFVSLKQIIKLDLSRNMLTEIPENFGELKQLRHLDLYANQISRLPLSFSELKNLRWLDLKENPLAPAVASVAGPCSNLSECQACARNIVAHLSLIKLTVEEEKLRRLNTVSNNTTDNLLPKKAGKKKKKKTTGKDSKENLEKSEPISPSDEPQVERDTVEISANVQNHRTTGEKRALTKGNFFRYIVSKIAWLFFLGFIIGVLLMVILSIYSEQCDTFVNYVERNTGVPLKAFQRHSMDIFRSSVLLVSTWTKNVYNDLYHAYETGFRENSSEPSSE
ncbi:Leucine-rich repeat-containing protein 59 [Dufourea novaeangliae]|uniref:Leucine-rich repeat-containing protein 59 n=1 Tax=Dufourea novaeangliae TaxID=178035 RepID=A0A154NYG4_DUFNO|nr:Leucine-rich repeat-containing protein 59 [Dufourea novaeangliae]